MGDSSTPIRVCTVICCITGMHRSGTSLVAQWLTQGGLPLTIGGTIAPDISNPRGYIEDLDFVRLHAAHLSRIRRYSFGWNLAPVDFLHFNASELIRARELIAMRTSIHSAWGWKDPRTILFLTAWKELIPELKVIILCRPCAEVVLSLLTRGIRQRAAHLLINPLNAIQLWRAYNHLACVYQSRYPDDTIVVSTVQFPVAFEVMRDLFVERSGLTLAPVVLESLYATDLLHSAPYWLQRLCSACGSTKIEARLRAISIGQE